MCYPPHEPILCLSHRLYKVPYFDDDITATHTITLHLFAFSHELWCSARLVAQRSWRRVSLSARTLYLLHSLVPVQLILIRLNLLRPYRPSAQLGLCRSWLRRAGPSCLFELDDRKTFLRIKSRCLC